MESAEKYFSNSSPRTHGNARVFVFFAGVVILTGIASLLFADLLWRFGWSSSRTMVLVLFSILFFFTAIGCVTSIYGFILRRLGGGRRITQGSDWRERDIDGASTALVFPIYNEDVRRVFAGISTVYESLKRTGKLEHFDLFILSDTNETDKWIEEEHRWLEMTRELSALGRIFYRRRLAGGGGKSGNIRDFLRSWGRRYRYFIVLDADSVMSGATIVDLVKMMETHPTTGLIQTAPALFNGGSAFARMQQFANRLYGPVFSAGMNYYAQDGSNYWGHNAIIRTEPFMQFCDLPKLPGKKPFGGQILSHDFAEAALLRKENWEVWFAWDLDGSYEETPPSIIDNAKRDRRWCQGNLQHSMLLFARGLRGLSRVHLTLGIFSYLTGPLWFLFMLTGTYMLWYQKQTGLSNIAVAAFTPYMRVGPDEHALLVFGFVMSVIFLPKILSLLDLALEPARRRAFGGFFRATAGAISETIFSTLHAPVQMLFHTKFVAATLLGFGIRWDSQRRDAEDTEWSTALKLHGGHTMLGLIWGAVTWWLEPAAFWWFTPVLCGMVLSIPLSVLTSRESFGRAFRRAGLFLTPEETAPPAEIAEFRERLKSSGESSAEPARSGLMDVILDPYANALHVTFLRKKQLNADSSETSSAPADGHEAGKLGEKLLAEGPDALSATEQLALMSDPVVIARLHHEAWIRPPEDLGEPWKRAIPRPAA